jgi:hypothetical protein
MTTLATPVASFTSLRASALRIDSVTSDMDALASHMSHCSRTSGRFLRFHAAMESMQAVARPRMVTAAVAGILLLAIVAIV